VEEGQEVEKSSDEPYFFNPEDLDEDFTEADELQDTNKPLAETEKLELLRKAIADFSLDELKANLEFQAKVHNNATEHFARLQGIRKAQQWDAQDDTLNVLEQDRLISGEGLFDLPEEIPAIWGKGTEVLWAEGEPLLITGPTGVGKTTVSGQILRGRLGIEEELFGLPIRKLEEDQFDFWLAMDRPDQILRSLRRHFNEEDKEKLAKHFMIRKGPPMADFAADPHVLIKMVRAAEAAMSAKHGREMRCGAVYIDSLKDAAIGLADDKVGASLNKAIQIAIAEGVQVCSLHHLRKTNAENKTAPGVNDFYGSIHIVNGSGSCILLWGNPGDELIEFYHRKQPAEVVGDGWKIQHNHAIGQSVIVGDFNILSYIESKDSGVSVREVAEQMFNTETPDANQRNKVRRKLETMVQRASLRKVTGPNKNDPDLYYRLSITIKLKKKEEDESP